jgi:hypothetical protein
MAKRRKASEASNVGDDEAGGPVSDELDQIETSYLDKLVEIKEAQERLRGLIEKAESSKDKVSPEVFARVVEDYDTRIEEHEQEALPLREQARTEFEKLRTLHARLSKELDKARLDAEELKFRHELGELPDGEFEEKRKSSSQTVSRSEKAFAAADSLRERFLEVIPEPPAPEPAAEQAAAPSPEKGAPAPASPPPPPPLAGEPEAEEEGDEDLEATVYDVSAPRFDPDTASTQDSATPVARLVARLPDGSEGATHSLGRTTTIGRTPDNDIPLDFPEVSRHHARISATPEGFLVTDLKSGNGTYINDQRVDEGPLGNGDTLRFGSLAFVVHLGDTD